jgi:UDP-glucuronate decarboxylase
MSEPGDELITTLSRHDVREPFPSDLSATQIYHLACPASPDRFAEAPLEILETCFQGTTNVLNFARRCNARVLLASTSGKLSNANSHQC